MNVALVGEISVNVAARATRVPERSVSFWSGPAKILTPEVRGGGKGSRKLFSERNLVQLRVTHLLTQRWIALKTVRALMRAANREWKERRINWFQLFPSPGAELPEVELLTCTEGGDWKRWTSREASGGPWGELQRHEDAIVVNLRRVKEEILKQLIVPPAIEAAGAPKPAPVPEDLAVELQTGAPGLMGRRRIKM